MIPKSSPLKNIPKSIKQTVKKKEGLNIRLLSVSHVDRTARAIPGGGHSLSLPVHTDMGRSCLRHCSKAGTVNKQARFTSLMVLQNSMASGSSLSGQPLVVQGKFVLGLIWLLEE
jgi:hypothetical protein